MDIKRSMMQCPPIWPVLAHCSQKIWPPYCKRHCQMEIIEWKYCVLSGTVWYEFSISWCISDRLCLTKCWVRLTAAYCINKPHYIPQSGNDFSQPMNYCWLSVFKTWETHSIRWFPNTFHNGNSYYLNQCWLIINHLGFCGTHPRPIP